MLLRLHVFVNSYLIEYTLEISWRLIRKELKVPYLTVHGKLLAHILKIKCQIYG